MSIYNRIQRENKPSPWAVHCANFCGLQYLTEKEYGGQMDRPNSTWWCPACNGPAEWDDNVYENYLDTLGDDDDNE